MENVKDIQTNHAPSPKVCKHNKLFCQHTVTEEDELFEPSIYTVHSKDGVKMRTLLVITMSGI
jgi:hypothetical protein